MKNIGTRSGLTIPFDWVDFEDKLKNVDWFFDYIDDYSLYKEKHNLMQRVNSLIRIASLIDKERTDSLVGKYCPLK